MAESAVSVFFSYSRKDLEMRNRLDEHLSVLKYSNKVRTWHDLELAPGSEWEPILQHELNTADIILLLISVNFLASGYCYSKELQHAIERHNAGATRVIPVILSWCDWNHPDVPFSKLNVLPPNAEPIASWGVNQDQAFTQVAQQIRRTVEELQAKKAKYEEETIAAKTAQPSKQAPSFEVPPPPDRNLTIPTHIYDRVTGVAGTVQGNMTIVPTLSSEVAKNKPQEFTTPQQSFDFDSDDLSSDCNLDYTHLRDLLKAGNWKEADQETAKRMCEVMGRQQEGWLRDEDIEQFPCTDLRTIDQLWVKYSHGKFGFSVQTQIWQACGSPRGYGTSWEKFGDRVGWRAKGNWIGYSKVTFDISAPGGHFPIGWAGEGLWSVCVSVGRGVEGCFLWLFSRAQTCKL